MKKLYDSGCRALYRHGSLRGFAMAACFVFALATQAYAKAEPQSLSLRLENATLREALGMVKERTDIYLVFNEEAIGEQSSLITMEIENKTLREALAQIFRGLPFELEFTETTVLIKPLPKSQQPAETVTIKGRVVGTDGAPIKGVGVMVEGTSIGTATDTDGRYSITFPARENAVLVFTCLGMKRERHKYEGGQTLNITMSHSAKTMDEVVITGYQTLNARESASSTFQKSGDEVKLGGVTALDEMLQGVVPGMMVLNTSGEPGASPKIRIRGNATINGNKSPVWVVDGVIYEQSVPFTASDINSEDAAYLIGSAISGLNPNDIDKITVLKDASATAIYGIKAANGVVVITTKKGREGPAVIEYRGDVSFTERPNYRHYDRMNSRERMQLSKEIIESGLNYPRIPRGDSYETAYIDLINKKITQEEFAQLVAKLQRRNTDWYRILFRHAVTHTHNLTVSGGGAGTRYYFSGGYSERRGTAKGSESRKFNVMGKIDVTVNEWLGFWANVAYNTTRNEGFFPGVNPDRYAYNRSRTLPAYDEKGDYYMYPGTGANGPYLFNILKEMRETGESADIGELRTQLVLNIKPTPKFNYRGTFAYCVGNTVQRSWASDRSNHIARIRGYEFAAHDETSPEYKRSVLPYGGIMTRNDNRSTQYTITNTLEFRDIFAGVHAVNVMAGVEARSNRYKGAKLTGYGWVPLFGEQFLPVYTDDFIARYVQKGLLNPININTLSQVASFFATASYTYDGRYVFNANIRSDGSNKFGSDPRYRWLPTWSVAAKWNIIDEPFVKDIAWLDNLALRASYGLRGNVHDDSTPHLILSYGGRHAISGQEYYKIHRLPNPSLRWEKTHTWNFAVEFALLDNRLRGTVDLYRDRIDDLIIDNAVPTSTGRSLIRMNAGKMEKRGIEAYFVCDVVRGQTWSWNVGMTLGRNVEEVIYANANTFSESDEIVKMLEGKLAIEGAPVGAIYSFDFAGLSPENGHPLFYTPDGRKVHVGEPQLLKLVRSGSIFPKLYGGLDTHIGFKNILILDLAFTYNVGNVCRLPSIYEDKEHVFDPLTNVSTKLVNRWREPGDEMRTNIPALYDRAYIRSLITAENNNPLAKYRDKHQENVWLTNSLYDSSTARMARGDFLKLKVIGLTYILPKEQAKKLGLKSLRIKWQMMNVFTLADRKWVGIDPESAGANMPLRPYYTLAAGITF